MPISLKRAYEEPAKGDGYRVLIDGLWPRGVRKDGAGIDLWLKEVAPSSQLRKWFGHEHGKWDEFKRRYFRELDNNPEAVRQLSEIADRGKLTLVYGSREERFNNAAALKEYLEKK
jgi:uncharacterized protein YeaO (DUF488 family)